MILRAKLKNTDRLIFFFLSIWLLVDSFNGFFMRSGIDVPISQFYKSFVTLVIIAHTLNDKTFTAKTFLLILLLLLFVFNSFLNGEDVAATFTFMSKPVTSMIVYYYIIKLSKDIDNALLASRVIKILLVNGVVYSINILIGLLGFGYNSYTELDGIGFCGFFFAINEMSGVAAVFFPILMSYVYANYGIRYCLCSVAFCITVALLLSTKSAIIVSLFAPVLFMFFNSSRRVQIAILVTVGCALFIVAGYVQYFLDNSEYGAVQRFSQFAERDGLLTAFTSNRFEYWDSYKNKFFSAGLNTLLFGIGGNKTVEMDIYDALLNGGIVGLFCLFSMYFTCIKRASRSRFFLAKGILTSNIFIIITSIMAGHILFSSMAGMLIALSNALLKTNVRAPVRINYKNNYS